MSAREDEARRLFLHGTGQLSVPGGTDSDKAPRFAPSAHSVAEVLAYLDTVTDNAEYQRVLDDEAAGKGRKSIVTA